MLLRNLAVSGKRRIHGRQVTVAPEEIRLAEFLDSLSLTREQLIRIAILVGTDYNEGIYGIGPKKALKIVTLGTFEETIEEKLPDLDVDQIEAFFLAPPVREDVSPEWNDPDPDQVMAILCDDYGFSPDRIQPVLARIAGPPRNTSGQMRLDAWG